MYAFEDSHNKLKIHLLVFVLVKADDGRNFLLPSIKFPPSRKTHIPTNSDVNKRLHSLIDRPQDYTLYTRMPRKLAQGLWLLTGGCMFGDDGNRKHRILGIHPTPAINATTAMKILLPCRAQANTHAINPNYDDAHKHYSGVLYYCWGVLEIYNFPLVGWPGYRHSAPFSTLPYPALPLSLAKEHVFEALIPEFSSKQNWPIRKQRVTIRGDA